jgi:serine/threonine-protein kinase
MEYGQPMGAPADKTSNASLRGDDVLFGKLLVSKKYATEAQVRECMAEIAAKAVDARGRPVRLADVMIRKGYITVDAVEEVVRLRAQAENVAATTGMDTPRTAAMSEHSPEEVKKAAADPKRHFGKYVLLKEVGRGGMGAVYKAWDTALNRVVAVKVLTAETSKADVERFFREAQTVASLSHPNIAAVYDVGTVEGKHFLAMQFIEGRTLAGHKIAPQRAAEIARDAALALQHAHKAGIVHRDIKPQNIMTDKTGHAFVMDFGIAKSMSAKEVHLTQTGTVLGTPAYMSPEHAKGRVTAKSDVYSLGATLYESLTGRPPFKGATPVEVVMNAINKEVTPPSLVASGIPRDVEIICLKCMEKDPRQRYQTAKELSDDLTRFLKGEPILAQPPSTAQLIVRKLRKSKAILIAAGSAFVLVILAAIVLYMASAAKTLEQARGFAAEGDKAFDAGKYEEAVTAYTRALALDGTLPRANQRIAECRRKIEAAAAEAKRQKEEAERQRAEAERRKKEEEERQKRRQAASLEAGKGKEILDQARNDLYRPGANLEASRARALQAIAQFDAALALEPAHEEALTWRGRAHALRLDYDKAEADFSAAIRARADYAPALVERGQMLVKKWVNIYVDVGGSGYLKGPARDAADKARLAALADFTAAAKAGEAAKRDFFEGLMRYAQEQMPHAIEAFDRYLKENATDEEAHRLKGDALYFSAGIDAYGRTTESGLRILLQAVACYDEAIRLRTNYPEARAMRAVCFEKLGRLDQSQADLEAAVAIDRRNFIAQAMYARLLGAGGRFEEALGHFAAALEAKPDSIWARTNRAVSLAELRRTDEALKDLDDAITLNPQHMFPLQLKGALLGRLQRYAEAEAVLEKATRMEPNFPTAWFNLGLMRKLQRKFKEAREAYEEALRRGHPDPAKVRQELDSLPQ